MRFKHILLSILIALSISAISQSKHSIQINIEGFEGKSLLLTSYYGNKIRLADTAYSNNGRFEFVKSKPYPGGIYMAVTEDKAKIFEFIVNNEPNVIFNSDTSNIIRNMKITNSEENKVFFDYVIHNEKVFRKNRELSESLKLTKKASPEYNKLISEINNLAEESTKFKLNIIENNSNLFVSKLLNSMREVEVPKSIKDLKDSSAVYRYYKNHFWDNLDLSDGRFLRTPMLDKKIGEYFSSLVIHQPDTVIKEIDYVLSKAKGSQENFSYLIWKFISDYQNPKFMGFDKVFVHLAEKYFEDNSYKIDNATESVKKSIIDRAKKIKPLIIGSTAPNLIMIDSSGQYVSFQFLKNKYIVLLFWDYECSVCKREIKYFQENMASWNMDIGIYSININGDLDEWKKYIRDNKMHWQNVNGTRSVTQDFHDIYDIYGSPVIYLLDQDRKIIAKRMGAEQIPEIIKRAERK